MVSPMVGFDMTSPSISGHQRISLNDGNIFDSILMLQPKFPKDPGGPPAPAAAAPAAMAAAATAAAAAGFAAKMADEEEPRAEMADVVTATASVAMMISRKKQGKINIGKLGYSRGWWVVVFLLCTTSERLGHVNFYSL